MDVDLAIVGSGFGGSILAMVARRLGCASRCSSAAAIPRSPSASRRRRWPAS
jgi:flavin-dependent dehydrogenase